MRILISGASGLVGGALTNALRTDGQSVAHFVRAAAAAVGRSETPAVTGDVRWDPARGEIDVAAIEGADAVIHLSGASIASGRWNAARKELLRTSRVDSTRLLVKAMAALRQKPRVFLCASAIGIYGDRGDEILNESSAPGTDFLSGVAREWEAEARRAEESGIRTVLLRFGVILAADEGALPRIAMPFRFGVGGRLGSGRQWMSWIALEDVVGAARAALADEQMSRAVNLVAPNPVRNDEFTRVLAQVLHRPAIFPAPAFALRLALGEMADALLLVSQRVQPERLLAKGFAFRYAELELALRALLNPGA
jgi:uncharacterized protein (TIGR01777 family)